MKKIGIFLLLLVVQQSVFAQKRVITDTSLLLPAAKMEQWRDGKFGLFVHFGLYSILEKGEWVQFMQQIGLEKYAALAGRFHPRKGSAERWAALAHEAGCKYMVLTSKHHDGFALFDTKFGNYSSMHSAAQRDIIRHYVRACRENGLLTGLYYSPLDWRYPGFFFPDLYRQSADSMKAETYWQVNELLSHYGKIDILWYDGGGDDWLGLGGLEYTGSGWRGRDRDKYAYTGKFHWEPMKLNREVRRLQPDIIINSRSGLLGDFDIMEAKFTPRTDSERPWEFCVPLQKYGWGYVKDAPIKTSDSCIKLLAKVICNNGNLLLNVGPEPSGDIDTAQVRVLKEIGAWMRQYGESVYGTRGGIWNEDWGGTVTKAGATYVHILKLPEDRTLVLPASKRKISSARDLGTGQPVEFLETGSSVVLYGLKKTASGPDLVIELKE